ncbi:dihydrolipoamide acetyltransferase family protein [[Eubacterium] cellulosolvens]
MVSLIKMPKSDLTMKEGTILKWYKQEGEKVEKGDPLVQIMAEKSTIDLEAPASGTVKKVYFKEQTDVPVGEVLVAIGSPEEEIPLVKEEAPPVAVTSREEADSEPVPQERGAVSPAAEVRASPLAKKIARDHKIDLALIPGTGPGGRIVEADVQKFLERKPSLAVEEKKVKESIPLSGMRKIIAEKMSLSSRTYSRITLITEVDASEMKRFRERLKAFENMTVSYTDILVKAVAKALTRHPHLNASLEGDEFKVFEGINIGVAVTASLGLVVPVVHNVGNLTLTEISKQTRELIEKARKGILSKEELSQGTFTITNLGMFGIDLFTPIINPPETAILGVGSIKERPFVEEGKITSRPTMFLSLSVDHRVVDGAPAAEFMQTLKKILEGIDLTEE